MLRMGSPTMNELKPTDSLQKGEFQLAKTNNPYNITAPGLLYSEPYSSFKQQPVARTLMSKSNLHLLSDGKRTV